MKLFGLDVLVTPLVEGGAILPKPTLWLVTRTGDMGEDARLVWLIPSSGYRTGGDLPPGEAAHD